MPISADAGNGLRRNPAQPAFMASALVRSSSTAVMKTTGIGEPDALSRRCNLIPDMPPKLIQINVDLRGHPVLQYNIYDGWFNVFATNRRLGEAFSTTGGFGA